MNKLARNPQIIPLNLSVKQSITKAEKQLGYTPKYSNKQALIRNYEWYIAHLNSFKNASGVSHRVPWKQGILGIVKHLF